MKPDNTYFNKIFHFFGNSSVYLLYDDELSGKPSYFPDNEIVFSKEKTYRDFTITINGFKSSGRKKYLSDQSNYKKYLEAETRHFYKEILNNTALLNTKQKIIL